MATTVAKLSELPIFAQGGQLVAGAQGLDNPVRFVTVMEVPEYNIASLNDDVFILTTLFAYREHVEDVDELMEKLCKQKVAGVAVKLERFIDKLPQSVIDIAEQYNVPLFTFGKNTTFRGLISEISAEIINDQRALIEGIHRLNKSLVGAVLRGDKTEVILRLLCNKIDCYCACVSLKGELIGEASSLPPAEEAKQIRECFGDIVLHNDSLRSGTMYFTLGDFSVFPCVAHEQTMGFLIVKVDGSIGEQQMLFAQELVSFLSIRFLEEYLKFETEQHMISAVLDEILFKRQLDETVIADRLKLLGFNPQKNHVIIRVVMNEKSATGKLVNQRKQFEYWRVKFTGLFSNAFVFWKGNELVVLASFQDKSQYCWDESVKQSLSNLIGAEQSDESIDMGYSMIVKDLRKLPECYEHAIKAINYGKALEPEKHLYSYNDYVEIGLISHTARSSESQLLKEKILAPILEYDKNFNAHLWNTLERSLVNNSLDAAAKSSFIHISTLRYRLEKIKLITGIDFFTPNGKFLLYLTYLLSKVDSENG